MQAILEKQKMLIKKYLIILSGIILFLPSCQKDPKSPSWDIDVLAPIIESTIDIYDIFDDSLTTTNSDNSVNLVFDEVIYEFSLDTLFNIPDTITDELFQLPVNLLVQPGQKIVDYSKTSKIKIHNAEITNLIVDSGFIDFEVLNTIKEDIVCTYTIPSAILNGNSLVIKETIPAATNQATYFTKKVSIAGYNIDLKGSGNSSNTLNYNVIMEISPNASPVMLTSQDSFVVKAKIVELMPYYAKGYFGSDDFIVAPTSTDVKIFDIINDGKFDFEKVNASFVIENGFGIDARFKMNYLTSINSKTNNVVSLNSSFIGNSTNISRASETYVPANPVALNIYTFPLDNPNIKKFIQNMPDKIGYSLDIKSNPLGNVTSGNDFYYKNHKLKAYFNMEIPLSITLDELSLQEIVDFDINKNDKKSIKDGVFTLIADNGFPFSVIIQFYMLDENETIIDSLLTTTNFVLSAPIDFNHKVIGKKRTILKMPVSEEKMNKLYNTKKLMIEARLNTAGMGQHIKIYDDYKLDIKLSGDFNYTLNN